MHYVVSTTCFIKYCDTLLAHALSSSLWLNLSAPRNIWQKLESRSAPELLNINTEILYL